MVNFSTLNHMYAYYYYYYYFFLNFFKSALLNRDHKLFPESLCMIYYIPNLKKINE